MDTQPKTVLSRFACEPCRKKKVKCDMLRPSCGLCRRTSSTCTFATKRRISSVQKEKKATVSTLSKNHLDLLARLLGGDTDLLKASASDTLALTRNKSQPPNDNTDAFTTLQSEEGESVRRTDLSSPSCSISTPSVQLPGTASDSIDNEIEPCNDGHRESDVVFLNGVETTATTIETESTSETKRMAVSYELASHLVEVYFDTVSPWLQLLHRPATMRLCDQALVPGPDALRDAEPEDKLLMLSMFSLAARHSRLSDHWTVPASQRGKQYAEEAHMLYLRNREPEPSIRFLQGCLMLAYYYYSSGISLQGYILVGVCVRLAEDMGLPRLDAGPGMVDLPADRMPKEELRRAWWATWELDTYGSTLLLRPFSVDQRHVAVKLPISDQDWISGANVQSEVMHFSREINWAALGSSPNQSKRAWFMAAQVVLDRVIDKLLLRQPLAATECTVLENDIGCLKLSLPPAFSLQAMLGSSELDTADKNWIIGTHLIISATSQLVQLLSCIGQPSGVWNEYIHSRSHMQSAMEKSAILRAWSPDNISTAHPFYASAICPVFGCASVEVHDSPAYRSYQALSDLTLNRFAEKWDLGRLALRINSQSVLAASGDQLEFSHLAKRYPIFMRRYLHSDERTSPEPHVNVDTNSSEIQYDLGSDLLLSQGFPLWSTPSVPVPVMDIVQPMHERSSIGIQNPAEVGGLIGESLVFDTTLNNTMYLNSLS